MRSDSTLADSLVGFIRLFFYFSNLTMSVASSWETRLPDKSILASNTGFRCYSHNPVGKQVKFRVHILQAGICCALLATLLVAQKQTFAPANDVSFKISTASTTWTAGESITLKYRVKNISNAPLFVPREWTATCPASPHLWAWFEDSSGKHFVPGYGGDCSPRAQTIRERMNKEAVLLKPGEQLEGTFLLDPKLFGLKPGAYRVEAALTGWDEEKFTDAERSELARMGSPFMTGEVPDSIRITLTPSTK